MIVNQARASGTHGGDGDDATEVSVVHGEDGDGEDHSTQQKVK